jgi:hypothetical protein
MTNMRTWMRRVTDTLLSVAIQKKVHPSTAKALHNESARLGPLPMQHSLPSIRVDKSRITLPRCGGTGSGDWRSALEHKEAVDAQEDLGSAQSAQRPT